nr:MAG TPA: hypothetical protein [Caudoviricetes sp.]
MLQTIGITRVLLYNIMPLEQFVRVRILVPQPVENPFKCL